MAIKKLKPKAQKTNKNARVQVRLIGDDVKLKEQIESISRELNIPVSKLVQSELYERFKESGILPAIL